MPQLVASFLRILVAGRAMSRHTSDIEPHPQSIELRVPWLSIRFQISTLLLLSALNAMVVVAYAVALSASQGEAEGSNAAVAASSTLASITPVHRQLVAGEEEPEELEPLLDRLGGQLLDLEDAATPALSALGEYRDGIDASAHARAAGSPPPSSELNRSYFQLLGAVQMIGEGADDGLETRYRWLLGALMFWVVLVAGITVASAFRLRRVLSRPLTRLSQAAMAVAEGDLNRAIAPSGSASEFHHLARAFETMRRELVRSIARLDHQNAVVKAMLDTLGDGILLLDRSRQVLEYNPAATRHLAGIAPPDLSRARKLPVNELLPGLDRELFMRGKNSDPVQLHYTLDGGIERYLEVSLEALAGVGHDLDRAYVMVVRDVTRAVEVENLQRSFLSVVTHELKTPLTVIEGYVRLLQMGKGGELSPKQAGMLQKVRSQAELLKTMVQDLLDTTRLEGGHLALDGGPVTVFRVVSEVVESLRPDALSHRLELSLARGEGHDAVVMADEFRLRQVLSNLLRNAFKFTEAGGDVSVLVERQEDELVVHVEDTGRGIPEAAMPHIFEKFYQVEAADTRKAGGAGLGLYICDQLVRAMGGSAQVRSRVGHGSRFTLRFPVIEPGVGAPEATLP